jgi:hypothetical protein
MESISKQEPHNWGPMYMHFKNDFLKHLNAVSTKIFKVVFSLGVSSCCSILVTIYIPFYNQSQDVQISWMSNAWIVHSLTSVNIKHGCHWNYCYKRNWELWQIFRRLNTDWKIKMLLYTVGARLWHCQNNLEISLFGLSRGHPQSSTIKLFVPLISSTQTTCSAHHNFVTMLC